MFSRFVFALDPQKSSPPPGCKPRWRAWLLFLAVIAAGLVLGGLVGNLLEGDTPEKGPDEGLNLRELLIIVPGLLLALLLVLGLHEAGHLIGGRLVGFRFLLYIAGPLMIVREGDRISIGLNRILSLYGGLAASVPTDNRDLRRRMAVMTAGGPLTSFLLGLLVIGSLNLFNLPQAGPWRLLLITFGAASLVIGLVTGIPMRSGGFNSDGARVLSLIRGGPAAERWTVISAITAASLGGVRPREWQPAWLETALSLPDGSLDDISAHLLAYSHHLDRGDVARAAQSLEYALAHAEGYPSAFRPALYQEAAYFTAIHQRDPSAARAYLEQGQGTSALGEATKLRAEAAVLYAEGRQEAAAETARRGLQALERSVDRGSAQAEAEWLQAIINH